MTLQQSRLVAYLVCVALLKWVGCQGGADTCSDECVLGEFLCESDNLLKCADFDNDSCLEWGLEKTCTHGCLVDRCACEKPCSTPDQVMCEAGKIYSCEWVNTCLSWVECLTCSQDNYCGDSCQDCTDVIDAQCAGSCNSQTCSYPTDRCGTCMACDGAGGCTYVQAGQDPWQDCGDESPCSQKCDGLGSCVFPDENTQCGYDCQHCDGSGSCLADCSVAECINNLTQCQCQPVESELTCGSTIGDTLASNSQTTSVLSEYGETCMWTSEALDGQEMSYRFRFTGLPNQRAVQVSVYSGLCTDNDTIYAIALGDNQPCDPLSCVSGQSQVLK